MWQFSIFKKNSCIFQVSISFMDILLMSKYYRQMEKSVFIPYQARIIVPFSKTRSRISGQRTLREVHNSLFTGTTFPKFARGETSRFHVKGYMGINVKFENYLAFFFILNVSAPQNSWFRRYSLFAMNFNWASDRFRKWNSCFYSSNCNTFWFDVNQPGVQNVDFWILFCTNKVYIVLIIRILRTNTQSALYLKWRSD